LSNNTQQEIAVHCSSAGSGVKNRLTIKNSTIFLVLTAVFAALTVVFKAYSVNLVFVVFTFTYIAWFLAAIILGPGAAILVVLAGETLGVILGGSPINIALLFSNMLFPIIMWLCWQLRFFKPRIRIVIAMTISVAVITMGLNACIIHTVFLPHMQFSVFWLQRTVQIPIAFINAGIIIIIVDALVKHKVIDENGKLRLAGNLSWKEGKVKKPLSS